MTLPIMEAVTFSGESSIRVVRFSSVRPTLVTPIFFNSFEAYIFLDGAAADALYGGKGAYTNTKNKGPVEGVLDLLRPGVAIIAVAVLEVIPHGEHPWPWDWGPASAARCCRTPSCP